MLLRSIAPDHNLRIQAPGSQCYSEWWQFGAPEERTRPLTETRIFIGQLERLPLQLIPPACPTANRILWASSEELWRPLGDTARTHSLHGPFLIDKPAQIRRPTAMRWACARQWWDARCEGRGARRNASNSGFISKMSPSSSAERSSK